MIGWEQKRDKTSKGEQEAHEFKQRSSNVCWRLLKVNLKLNPEFPSSHNSAEPTIDYLIYGVYNVKTNSSWEEKLLLVEKFNKNIFLIKAMLWHKRNSLNNILSVNSKCFLILLLSHLVTTWQKYLSIYIVISGITTERTETEWKKLTIISNVGKKHMGK